MLRPRQKCYQEITFNIYAAAFFWILANLFPTDHDPGCLGLAEIVMDIAFVIRASPQFMPPLSRTICPHCVNAG
jgi:hypothetical protein